MALLTRLALKAWNPREVNNLLGHVERVYFSYAQDPALRQRSASGGSVSALLIHLLETGQIDGALVLTTVVVNGSVQPRFMIAETPEAVMAAQGSKYIAVHFAAHAMPLIREYPGRLAVVALPCDAALLYRARQKDPALDEKVRFVFALFCGHNSEPELTHHIVDQIRGDHGVLQSYHYRSGHWRGKLTAEFEDGAVVTRPFGLFSLYRNLYFFTQRKCHHCYDHFGYYCDMSAGDIWSLKMRKEPIKHTALVARTWAGLNLLAEALDRGVIAGREATTDEVCDGQSRTAPFHYNITARARVGRLFGMRIKDDVRAKVRWPDYIVAFMALANQRLSATPAGRRLILMTPRPFLKAYLYLLKALEVL